MHWHDYVYVFAALCTLFALVYSWIWWFRTGRHQSGQRVDRAKMALVYGTALPLILLGLTPTCDVPVSYVGTGLPLVAVGLLAALLVKGQGRWLLMVTTVGWYFVWTQTISFKHPC